MAVRVIQWATGHVGIHALRAIARHPGLELVGLCVSSPEKDTKDAGELCGIGPIGVSATRDVQAILALEADCVCYTGATDFRLGDAIDDMCRILESGKNLVTSSFVPSVFPWRVVPHFAERIDAAAKKGRASFYCSGIDPGFSPDALPITLSSMCERIDSIRAQEIFNYSTYDQPETLFTVMGFGQPPEHVSMLLMPGALGMAWGGSVGMVAHALGVGLEEIRQRHELAVAEETFEISCGRIEKGTIAGIRFEVSGIVGGEPRITVEHVTRLRDDVAPEWPRGNGPGTYRVIIEGMPSFRCDLDVGFRSIDHNVDGCVATAMRLVNAIPAVCRAEPGLRTWLDLPVIAGHGAMRTVTDKE